MPAAWPWQGLAALVAHPSWLLRAVLAMLAGWLLILALGIAASFWAWPAADAAWWWLRAAIAVGVGAVAAASAWLLLLPFAVSLGLEWLARAVQQAAGHPPHDLPLRAAVPAALRVLLATLPLRLLWLLAMLVALPFGPLAVMVAALAAGHLACRDAADVALSLRGLDGGQRLAVLRAQRGELLGAGAYAALLAAALAPLGVTWLVWLPAIAVGAARRVLAWPLPTPR